MSIYVSVTRLETSMVHEASMILKKKLTKENLVRWYPLPGIPRVDEGELLIKCPKTKVNAVFSIPENEMS